MTPLRGESHILRAFPLSGVARATALRCRRPRCHIRIEVIERNGATVFLARAAAFAQAKGVTLLTRPSASHLGSGPVS